LASSAAGRVAEETYAVNSLLLSAHGKRRSERATEHNK
jgi:hypothetical protein